MQQYWSMAQLREQLRRHSLPIGEKGQRIINHRGLVWAIQQPKFNYKHISYIADIVAGKDVEFSFINTNSFQHFISPPHIQPPCRML